MNIVITLWLFCCQTFILVYTTEVFQACCRCDDTSPDSSKHCENLDCRYDSSMYISTSDECVTRRVYSNGRWLETRYTAWRQCTSLLANTTQTPECWNGQPTEGTTCYSCCKGDGSDHFVCLNNPHSYYGFQVNFTTLPMSSILTTTKKPEVFQACCRCDDTSPDSSKHCENLDCIHDSSMYISTSDDCVTRRVYSNGRWLETRYTAWRQCPSLLANTTQTPECWNGQPTEGTTCYSCCKGDGSDHFVCLNNPHSYYGFHVNFTTPPMSSIVTTTKKPDVFQACCKCDDTSPDSSKHCENLDCRHDSSMYTFTSDECVTRRVYSNGRWLETRYTVWRQCSSLLENTTQTPECWNGQPTEGTTCYSCCKDDGSDPFVCLNNPHSYYGFHVNFTTDYTTSTTTTTTPTTMTTTPTTTTTTPTTMTTTPTTTTTTPTTMTTTPTTMTTTPTTTTTTPTTMTTTPTTMTTTPTTMTTTPTTTTTTPTTSTTTPKTTTTTRTTTTTAVQSGPLYAACNVEKTCPWIQSNWDTTEWHKMRGNTQSADTRPDNDHTLGNANGAYFYIEASSPSKPGDYADLISPSLSANTTRCLEFWYSMYGDGIGTLNVTVQAIGRTAINVFNISGNQGKDWKKLIKTIPNIPYTYNIIITGTIGPTYHGDIAIDDIVITSGKCQGPFSPNLIGR